MRTSFNKGEQPSSVEPAPGTALARALDRRYELWDDPKAFMAFQARCLADHFASGDLDGRAVSRELSMVRAFVIQVYVKRTFGCLLEKNGISVAFVGGDGQAWSGVRSDLDLAILAEQHPQDIIPQWRERARSFQDLLYAADLKWELVNRVVPEIPRYTTDLHAATALLSLRHVAGSEQMSSAFRERFHQSLCDNAYLVLEAGIADKERRLVTSGAGLRVLNGDFKFDDGGYRDLSQVFHLLEIGRL